MSQGNFREHTEFREPSFVRKVDAIDRKILATLQESARITNVELADRTGLSPPPCLRRRQRLEDLGYIRGYHAEVNAAKLGYEVSAFIFVGLISQTDADIRAFEKTVRNWPLVRKAYAVAGSIDMLLYCVASDLNAFQSFVTEKVMTSPRVSTVRTSIAMRVVKNEAGIPIS